jgi:hypothetical protein
MGDRAKLSPCLLTIIIGGIVGVAKQDPAYAGAGAIAQPWKARFVFSHPQGGWENTDAPKFCREIKCKIADRDYAPLDNGHCF